MAGETTLLKLGPNDAHTPLIAASDKEIPNRVPELIVEVASGEWQSGGSRSR